MKNTNQWWVCSALFTGLLLASCGSSDSGSSGAGATSTQVPAPPPAGGEVPAWASVTEVVSFCDYPVCSGSDGFTVQADGTYRIGDGTHGSGSLTPGERTSFAAAAAAVAVEDPIINCKTTAPLPGASRYNTTMTLTDQSSLTVVDVAASETCILGDDAMANALHVQMNDLERKYDPRTFP